MPTRLRLDSEIARSPILPPPSLVAFGPVAHVMPLRSQTDSEELLTSHGTPPVQRSPLVASYRARNAGLASSHKHDAAAAATVCMTIHTTRKTQARSAAEEEAAIGRRKFEGLRAWGILAEGNTHCPLRVCVWAERFFFLNTKSFSVAFLRNNLCTHTIRHLNQQLCLRLARKKSGLHSQQNQHEQFHKITQRHLRWQSSFSFTRSTPFLFVWQITKSIIYTAIHERHTKPFLSSGCPKRRKGKGRRRKSLPGISS